jgi:hypothetical protein
MELSMGLRDDRSMDEKANVRKNSQTLYWGFIPNKY